MLNVRRPVGRLLFWMLLMVMAAVSEPRVLAAVPATTTVTDVIYRADGTPAQGTLLISWPAFATKTGEPVAAGSKSVKIGTGGAVSIALVPNTGATPAGTHYTVVLKLADGTTSTEFWTVPDAGTATVAAIRSKIVPATVAAQFVARDYIDSALAGVGDAVMHKAGAETITGAKTFAIAPVVPLPSTDGEAANKAYVDSKSQSASGSGGEVSVKDFGAKGDARAYSLCSIGSGSRTLTAAAANIWSAADLGKIIRVAGAGASGVDLISTIAAFTDGQHITLADAASTAVTGRGAVWGSSIDDSAAVQAAVNAVIAAGGGTVKFPQGMYPLASTITVQSQNSALVQGVRLVGMGGMKATMLLWVGADGSDVIREGVTADSSKAMTMAVENFGFESLDSQSKTKKAGAFINLYFGMMHHVTRNWFGVATNHVKGRGFYLSKFDHNWWYGATGSCFYAPNDDAQASVNGNFVVFNEFGACGRYAVENVSMGAGGSNQNLYAFNDFEQAIPGALGTLYLIDSASQVISNRFEDLSALTAEFRELTIAGGSNKVAFNQFGAASPMQYAVTILAGSQGNLFLGNNYTGNGASGLVEVQTGTAGNRSVGEDLRRNAIGGAGASAFDIEMSRLALLDAGSNRLLRANDPDNTRKWNTLGLYGTNITPLPGDGGNPSKPAPYAGMSGAAFSQGDIVLNAYAATNGNLGWVCTSATCTWDGTAWTGTWNEVGMVATRKRREASAQPASGTWVAGDFVWNTTGTSKIVGWLCTAGGTPGTWQTLYAGPPFDGTAPGPIGTTTASTGKFTSVTLGDGTLSAPGMAFSAETNTGWRRYTNGSPALTVLGVDSVIFTQNYFNQYRAGGHQFGFGYVGDGIISTRSIGAYCWSGSASNGITCDTKLTRAAAGVVSVDSATSGDGAGTLKASKIQWTSASTPVTSTDACTTGQAWYDANYLYVCTAANQIKRVGLSSF